jgi:release factor glutamine methyltransferase
VSAPLQPPRGENERPEGRALEGAERRLAGPPASERSERAARPSEGRAKKEDWSVLELVRWTTDHFASRGIESARLDAELLLAAALGVERLELYVQFDKPVVERERALYRELVRRRANERVPVAQLLGRREFWSLPLAVTADVLVPRPETETLVAAALERAPDPQAAIAVLDVGTGSGAVALAIARERPRARIVATDVSQAALEVARRNAEALGLTRQLRFARGDLFEPVAGERFDLVVSNPPYLGERERAGLAPELAHEPDLALFAGDDGLALLRRLAVEVPSVLAEGGAAAFELAPAQAPAVSDWCRAAGLLDVRLHRDLAKRPRVVSGCLPPSPRTDAAPLCEAPRKRAGRARREA